MDLLNSYYGGLWLFLNGFVRGYGYFDNGFGLFVVVKFIWILCVVNFLISLNGVIVKVLVVGCCFLDSVYERSDSFCYV